MHLQQGPRHERLQPASAPDSGPGGRRFKSSLPDQENKRDMSDFAQAKSHPVGASEGVAFRSGFCCSQFAEITRRQRLRADFGFGLLGLPAVGYWYRPSSAVNSQPLSGLLPSSIAGYCSDLVLPYGRPRSSHPKLAPKTFSGA